FAALSALGATLTLPGIAGIVLGVGLAVDANNLSMLPMALAGGTAVDNFAIAMVFGIVVGASSSIFVAAPILLFLGEGRLRPAWASPDRPAAAVEPDGVAS
ncbi:MAG: hypothetical protein AB7F22_35155, partial [Reyranella sp.]|uniref:hypothetical protein n=1 Tax=Reyranella sp. TaxID=1929291 RepID=UPI003D0FB93F